MRDPLDAIVDAEVARESEARKGATAKRFGFKSYEDFVDMMIDHTEAECVEQGLPLKVESPAVLAQIGAIWNGTDDGRKERRRSVALRLVEGDK